MGSRLVGCHRETHYVKAGMKKNHNTSREGMYEKNHNTLREGMYEKNHNPLKSVDSLA